MVRQLGPWKDQAACLDADPDLFVGDDVTPIERERAVAICHGCPVREECLAYALDTRQMFGIWGGLDERQRRAVVERLARRAVTEPRRKAPRP